MFKRGADAKNRIWEIDFLRGFLILLVVLDHFMFNVNQMGVRFESGLGDWLFALSTSYYSGGGTVIGQLRQVIRYPAIMLFALVSGMSSQFSRNNLKRGLLLLSVGVGFSVICYILSLLNIGVPQIWFNVIHVLSISILIYALSEFLWKKCEKPWQKNLFLGVMSTLTIFIVIVGQLFVNNPYSGSPFLSLFIDSDSMTWSQITPGDYLSLFPALGWFLIGAALSKKLYKERKTLFPSVNQRYVAPMSFIGRNTLWVYFGSQVIMFGLIYFFAYIV